MKFMKRVLVIGFCATLMLSSVNTVYAMESFDRELNPNAKSVKIENIAENTVSVQTGSEQGAITVTENENERLITMTDSVTGDTNYIKYDKIKNTVYSSFTWETIDLNENLEYQPEEETALARSVTSYETKKISYAQIKKIVGRTATATAVIGAILYFVPGAQSIGGAASAVGTIVDGLSKGISSSSNHGIKLKIKVTKYYRGTTGNKHVYKRVYSIVGGSVY